MKGIIFLLFIFALSLVSQAQSNIINKAPLSADKQTKTNSITRFNSPGSSNQYAEYHLVDYMANAFGPASSSINPLVYDTYSDVAAIVHRGHSDYAAGSGELWYNISLDKGVTWNRVSPGINSSFTQENARYPGMAISNPQQSPGVNDALSVFSWTELDNSTQWIGYAADQPAGGGNFTGNILMDDYSLAVPIWTSDNSPWVFWIAASTQTGAMTLFRTQDFITIEQIDFPYSFGGFISLGGTSANGIIYVGALGIFPPPDPGDPIISGWYPGYIKSTDNGVTWSDWQVIDFRQVPAVSDYDRLYDFIKNDSYVSYCGDMNVDNNGFVHFALALTDTTTDENTGINSIVDLYEINGGWDAKIIYTGLIDGSFDNGPGMGQMGPSPYFAFNAERDVMACQWVNAVSENIPWCDLFFSYRTLSSNWADPINLTESDSINNSQSHLAQLLSGTGPEYTAFSMYSYQDGVSGPYTDTLASTNIYVAPVTFNIDNVPVELVNINTAADLSFELSQNFPNPFNPATEIRYKIPSANMVVLKLYDVLGHEVKTLVNDFQEAGPHHVIFNSNNLASGTYFYKLSSGNYIMVKKMLLLK